MNANNRTKLQEVKPMSKQEKILSNIRNLEKQLQTELQAIEQDGKQVIVKYDKATNKDELYIVEQ